MSIACIYKSLCTISKMSHLPSPGLGIDQTTDRLHDGRINQMGTPEAVGHDCPIFYPTDAMFHPDPDGAQLGIEGLLLFGQFLAGHFFEGCADRQAGDQQPEPRFGVARMATRPTMPW